MKTKITLLVLTALLGLTNVFANSMPTSENVVENEMMTTADGNLIIISAGKRIYSLDMNTYHATLLATSPYVNEINSIASDNTTGWLFYVSNHISRYNWTIYGYNVYSNTHKNFGSVRHFFTSTGHAHSSRGLASGGATFYNGKLYFAMEYPVRCYYYRDGRRVSNNSNPKDELDDNPRGAGTGSTGLDTSALARRDSRGITTRTYAATETDNGGREGNGESPEDFVVIEAEEANQANDNVNDYIAEEELPDAETEAQNPDEELQQRASRTSYQAQTYSYNYYHSSYNNKMYLLEISFNGLSDISGQTTSVAHGTPVYDNWWYSSFLYKGELGDIVVGDNGQMYAATSYQVQAYNFNSNRYDWANNEDVYAQMAKDKNSHLQLLKNKRTYTTYYYYGCPYNVYQTKSYVQKYTAPSSLRTYNNIQLGSLIEISGLEPQDVGQITDASDYINLTPPVSYKIKGFVFDDNNENGNFNGGQGETKTSGITVTLYADNNNDNVLDSGDTVIDSQVTGSNGSYTFNNVEVAETLVVVSVPNNTNTTTYTSTTPETVAVTGSTNDVTVKFGINEALIPVNYDVFGTVYDDDNADAIFDNGEAGLENVTLTLYNDTNADGVLDANDTVIATTTSGADGSYSFVHVCVQNTIVAVTVPTNTGDFTYTLTTAGTQAIDAINTDVTGVDFGVNKEQVINYVISGKVYDDNDESGAQDAGEDNLESITVTLYDDSNANGAVDAGESVIATATTAADGKYSFAGVTVQNTVVAVTVPGNTAEFTYTLTTAGEVNTSSTNVNVENVNFGINEVQVIDYNISGTVYDDDNANGVNDTEAGLDAITVKLYSDNDESGTLTAGDGLLEIGTTAADGTYSFTNVTTQFTLVGVEVPANTAEFTYTATTAVKLAVSSTINDVTDQDFGINKVQIIDYNITGNVFDDDNANSAIDAGERALENVTLTLYADNDGNGRVGAADTVISTTTSANDGTYSFSNVTVERTVVAVTVPSNSTALVHALTTSSSVNTSSTIADVNDVDFGINREEVINYNISGTVFDDNNENSAIDAGEGSVENVTIELYADNDGNGRLGGADTVITTTTSANDGTYSFSNVSVRNTLVVVTVPTNTATVTYTLTTSRTLAISETINDVNNQDFGINSAVVVNYNIFGTVYDDDNENAILDASETGRLENITLTLYIDDDADGRLGNGDTVLETTTTAADGTYSFLNVTEQNTVVAVTIPQNTADYIYTLTTDARLDISSVDTDVTDQDFGINKVATSYTVSGNVFNDENGDGTNASTEAGLRGVTVNLYEDVNGNGRIDRGEPLISTTASDRSGNYQFTGITATNVIVQLVVPSNTADFTYTSTTPVNVVLTGGVSTTVDFGIQRTIVILYNISGVVWDDQNSDQVKDANEPRLVGIGVTLFEDVNADGALDAGDRSLSTITTSATGGYQFSNVNLRNVLVVPTLPADGTFTTPSNRAISSINTDAVDIDFGIRIANTLYQVTGVVFNDQNENGIADPGEESLDGLPVEIYSDTDGDGNFDPNLDALVAFTQTSNGGFGFLDPNYLVDDIPPGEVFIVVVLPDDTIFETYRNTYDPDSGTASPDGIYRTVMVSDLFNIDFGVKYENTNSTSRINNESILVLNSDTISEAPQDVSERLRLYPNPTVREIAINAEEFSGNVSVEIYNDRGYRVMSTLVSQFGGEYKIGVERLAPGMYYAKFESESGQITASKKFIKK